MKFSEVVTQTLAWLQREERVSYRALTLEFDLNDDVLDALKEEIIDAKRLAIDENGKVLVWTGAAAEPEPENRRIGEPEQRQTPSTPKPQPLAPNPQPPAAERRQLTVMFCDLVGSTALSAQLDPEDYRAVVQHYHATADTVLARYDGHVAQHLGDGLLVYFGYPVAHEDDARRAVRAGVEIIEALKAGNRQRGTGKA